MPLTVLNDRLKTLLRTAGRQSFGVTCFCFQPRNLMLSVGSNRECLKIRRRVSKCLFQDRLIHFNLFTVITEKVLL